METKKLVSHSSNYKQYNLKLQIINEEITRKLKWRQKTLLEIQNLTSITHLQTKRNTRSAVHAIGLSAYKYLCQFRAYKIREYRENTGYTIIIMRPSLYSLYNI